MSCTDDAERVLKQFMGHMGLDCTMDLVRTRIYWPKMVVNVQESENIWQLCMGEGIN